VPLNWIAVKKDDELRRRMREGEDRISGERSRPANFYLRPLRMLRRLPSGPRGPRARPARITLARSGEEGAARKRSFAGAARRIAAPADAPNRADRVSRNATKATLSEHAGIHAGMRSAESASLGSQSV